MTELLIVEHQICFCHLHKDWGENSRTFLHSIESGPLLAGQLNAILEYHAKRLAWDYCLDDLSKIPYKKGAMQTVEDLTTELRRLAGIAKSVWEQRHPVPGVFINCHAKYVLLNVGDTYDLGE